MKMLSSELKKLVFSPGTVAGVLLLYVGNVLSTLRYFGEPICPVLYMLEESAYLGFTTFLLAVAVVLPVARLQYCETSTGYHHFLMARSGVVKYLVTKIVAAAISGMVIMLLSAILYMITVLLAGNPLLGEGLNSALSWSTLEDYRDAVDNGTAEAFLSAASFYDRLLLNERYGTLLVIFLTAYVLNGALWPVLCLATFAFTQNKYLVAAVPFVLRMLGMYIFQRLQLFFLDSSQMLLDGVMRDTACGGLVYIVVFTLCGILLSGGIWSFSVLRRRKNG
jgi:hypothetical protein